MERQMNRHDKANICFLKLFDAPENVRVRIIIKSIKPFHFYFTVIRIHKPAFRDISYLFCCWYMDLRVFIVLCIKWVG